MLKSLQLPPQNNKNENRKTKIWDDLKKKKTQNKMTQLSRIYSITEYQETDSASKFASTEQETAC